MRIRALEPLPPREQPQPGEYGAGRCHSCHGNTARWLITFSQHRPFLKLCAKCAEFMTKRLGDLIAGRVLPPPMRAEDDRGNR